MGYFLTAKSRIEQTDILGYFRTLDNELYLDDDGTTYITPRYFWTDGYTFPRLVMAILGDKNRYDVRPAHAHDLFCRFHQAIKVKLSITQLKLMGFYKNLGNKMICEDIPKEYLEVVTLTKTQADSIFRRMMLSCDISMGVINQISFGILFNFNWYLKTGKVSLTTFDIFNKDIILINGV